jgi:hypothetical protein
MLTRRDLLRALGSGAAVAVVGPGLLHSAVAAEAKPQITVYRSPTCDCCADWASHLKQSGFAVKVDDVANMDPVKARFKIPDALLSCHTAVVDGYAVEGHVPADVIHKLLRDRPKVAGIAVPGMPTGSPGMEHEGHRESYQVFTFDAAGRTQVYARRLRSRAPVEEIVSRLRAQLPVGSEGGRRWSGYERTGSGLLCSSCSW